MNKDLLYIYDKITFKRQELGEIQKNFNMSLVIDGTKDSTKMVVWSFSDKEIEPYTICFHRATESYWVVSHDKVERYLNDNDTFIYVHNLELLGAIELFNARDLTDCGFNDKTYTVEQFITRLVSLSSLEWQGSNVQIIANSNFLVQQVDFIKTFENYTLLSALREFLDGYNMSVKLSFTDTYIGNDTYLSNALIVIIPKTGDNTLIEHDIDEFDDVRETKTMDKNSFGTCVVSNAENVISSVAKTYPSTGSVSLSSKQHLIAEGTNLKDAVIRLPSKVFKGNWIKIIHPLTVTLNIQGTVTHEFTYEYQRTDVSFNKMINYFEQKIIDETGDESIANEFLSYVDETLKNNLNLACGVTLYNGNNIDAFTGEIIKGDDVPYLATFSFNGTGKKVIFTDKSTKECLDNIKQGIAWERGSNEITGFDMFDGGEYLSCGLGDYQGSGNLISFESNGIRILLYIYNVVLKYVPAGSSSSLANQLKKLSFIINYIPMSDIKVKADNTRYKRDIQLYNQNGKITDNFALSKLINSYSKEISSDTITKYKCYRDFDDIPKVGSFVLNGNETYVVNNVSLDFTQNELSNDYFGYFIDCEITMSKYVSTKSLMVNPSTNIRDYGIPQNFNVKRKQVYRDFYEITYTLDSFSDNNYYLEPTKIFNIGREPNEYIDFIAVIQCDYDNEIGGYSNWYYQLETTKYEMNKMLYVVCDFNDNNIIGYASQNVYSGFVISRVFSGQTDSLNTPISYVDADGKVKGLDLLFLNKNQITEIYDEYQSEQTGGDSYEGSLYNYSVFIPQDIYLKAIQQDKYEIRITESTFVDQNSKDYNKDAIEVPVFEYGCQVDDSEDVLIGDNILTQHQGFVYFYHFIVGDNLTQDNVYDNSHITLPTVQHPYRYRMSNSATIEYFSGVSSEQLLVKLYNYTQFESDDNTWTEYLQNDIEVGKDLAIFRHALNYHTGEEIVELMFIAKKVPSSNISQSGKVLTLILNHYKLDH